MLTTEQRNAILLITLNRPDKRNALHPYLIDELLSALAEAASNPAINVILITGAGPSFCAGLDLGFLLSQEYEGKIAYLE
jgi:enoyl-CoA hydratase/carnithine racemase